MSVKVENPEKLIQGLKFDAQGLLGAIIQDIETHEVLMFAFMNREALDLTLKTGKMHYWSRSRQKLWLKGETSGHTQDVDEIRVDCDQDALIFKVKQHGGACHTGYYSCFYRVVENGDWIDKGRKVFDPETVY
jgi:phosphoribosyl-AMP cyclohydrolase